MVLIFESPGFVVVGRDPATGRTATADIFWSPTTPDITKRYEPIAPTAWQRAAAQ